MGYRSDVRIMTSKKGFDELRKFTDQYLKDKNYTYGNLLDQLDINHETKYAKYIGWNSIKWYENSGSDYDDVNAIMEGLSHLKDKDLSYRYARIGESYDDYDEHYYESVKEEEQDLEYPSMERYFDDDYVIDNMKLDAKEPELT